MKKEFSWYFPISEDEIDSIWKSGLLTVDANVLLDLYRYHESTRNSLINSLKEFKGRLWLSNQAAEEFIRNSKDPLDVAICGRDIIHQYGTSSGTHRWEKSCDKYCPG